MNKSGKNSGMTLIELIVSLALIGLLTIVFLTLFVGGLKMIGRSGEREKVKVAASSSMDNFLNDISYADSDITSVTGSVTIIYPDSTTKIITGKKAKINKTNSNGSQVEIKGFIP